MNSSTPAHIQNVLDHVTGNPQYPACACMGPQDDDPVCPCMMSSVIQWNGQWVDLRVIKPRTYDDYLADIKPAKLNPARLP
jgi:hypothetical protein